MTSSIEEYYTKNYSKCNISYNFLASWQGLAYPTHSIQIVALPIQIFTFYIMWNFTTPAMRAMKWPLLINHACCTIFDIIICSLATPYFFFQNTGYLSLGLFAYLGMSHMTQLIIGIPFGLLMAGSYVYMFESRSNILPMNRFRIKSSWKRVIYHFWIFLCNSTLLTMFLRTPKDQEAAKLKSLNLEPCPTREFFTNDVLIVMPDIYAIRFTLFLHAPFLLIHIICHTVTHVASTVYHLYYCSRNSISPETRKYQKTFFMAIFLQTTIPLSLGIIILVLVISAGIMGGLTQKIMNLIIIIFACHGFLESATILFIHRSYRDAVYRIIWGANRQFEVQRPSSGKWTTSAPVTVVIP